MLIHRRQAENLFNGADHAELIVVGVIYGFPFHKRTDDITLGAMAVHVIDSVLGVVFGNKDHTIFPVRAMADRIDHAAEREVIVSYLSRRGGKPVESPLV